MRAPAASALSHLSLTCARMCTRFTARFPGRSLSFAVRRFPLLPLPRHHAQRMLCVVRGAQARDDYWSTSSQHSAHTHTRTHAHTRTRTHFRRVHTCMHCDTLYHADVHYAPALSHTFAVRLRCRVHRLNLLGGHRPSFGIDRVS